MNDLEIPTRQASAFHGLAWVLAVFALACGAYESLPWMARLVPWSFERRAFGHATYFKPSEVCKPNEDSNRLLKRIYPVYSSDRKFSIDVSVIRENQINAFASPGGRIFVYNALIQQARSPEELAAVLAHEIEHVKRRHVIQGMIQGLVLVSMSAAVFPHGAAALASNLLELATRLRFSRSEEEEADAGALERLRDTQVSDAGFEFFFRKNLEGTSPPEILSDHPSNDSRLRRIRAFPTYPSHSILTPKQWKSVQAMCN